MAKAWPELVGTVLSPPAEKAWNGENEKKRGWGKV